jgi:hypothetical protein
MSVLATTELEAVNIMLAGIGEAPVATIAEDTIEDAQIALSILRQVSKEIQAEGWHFNTDYDYPLSVDAVTFKISYPTTACHVDAMDDSGYDVVKRGDYLYDRANRTLLFSDITTLNCVIVWMFDFTDLPQSFRVWITLRAARRFAENMMGDEASVKYTERDELEARMKAKADDLRRADLNMLSNSYTVSRIFRRRSPWAV